jgi:hypothetical protein
MADQTASLIPPEIPHHCFSCTMTVPGSISFLSQEHPQPAAILWSCSLKYPSRPQFSLNIWMTWVKCIRWEEKQRDRGREIKGPAHYRREIEKQQTHTHARMHVRTVSARGWFPTKLECSYPTQLSKVSFTRNRIRIVPAEFCYRLINALWSSEVCKVVCKVVVQSNRNCKRCSVWLHGTKIFLTVPKKKKIPLFKETGS